ncbi:type II secretion system protein E [Striga asiatica]|uniref:Type II secretion system protein E n=1 Tax=Striga asiatica TaxID=4170 RepID=A0A5A7Q0G7_STRAF|nr:type II secretion system protein E [Striga asiatica]
MLLVHVEATISAAQLLQQIPSSAIHDQQQNSHQQISNNSPGNHCQIPHGSIRRRHRRFRRRRRRRPSKGPLAGVGLHCHVSHPILGELGVSPDRLLCHGHVGLDHGPVHVRALAERRLQVGVGLDEPSGGGESFIGLGLDGPDQDKAEPGHVGAGAGMVGPDGGEAEAVVWSALAYGLDKGLVVLRWFRGGRNYRR